jgi:transposase-like protein
VHRRLLLSAFHAKCVRVARVGEDHWATRPVCEQTLSLRDLAEMFLIRGFVFTHEAVRDWEAKLAPLLAEGLRKRRADKAGRCWHVDET